MPFIQRFMFAAVALAVAVGSVAGSADAAPITFNFAGTVTQVTVDPDDIEGLPPVGTAITGSYTFDSTTVDAIAAAGSGSYTQAPISPFRFTVQIGSGGAEATFFNIGVVDGASSDFYSVLGCDTPACSTFLMELLFEDFDHTVFTSDALPLDAPPLAAFELARFVFRAAAEGIELEILGQITSLTCVDGCVATEPGPGPTPDPEVVPEPSTVVLCATGLLASVLRRRRPSSIQESQECL